ncbi:hypothetical protein SCHPADRAFT_188805 [Schizopora paradoxa]|uniref:Uncharacterized protein n=1 Tax=Schizopora paradoxa TaxID=27342 RepID=A0A0H2S5C0_9AGAM|nr:hypothetical protein SCHPADRAFT_188805 [Schizopora paradoxa]
MPKDSNTLRIGIPALDSLLVGLKCLREESGQCLDAASFWLNCLGISAEDSVHDVQKGFAHLKEARKALDMLAESIDLSVRRLSQLTETAMLSSGIANLPDELLARIFEIYAENHQISMGTEYHKPSSMVLASVCQRFRNITLHVPALWEIVSHDYCSEHVLMRKERCPNPRVYVHYIDELEEVELVSEYIEELHPNDKWKELDICYSGLKGGQLVLEGISENVQSPFEALKSLSIFNLGNEIGTEEEILPPTQLTEVSHQILDTWSFPVLTSLTLTNVIPRRLLSPNLKSMSLNFQTIGDDQISYNWDFASLKDLLGSLATLSSLYISFFAADVLTPDFGSRRVVLPNLSALSIDVHGQTNPQVLSTLMNAIDMPILAKFEIGMSGSAEDQPEPDAWLRALFDTSIQGARTFPTVQEFHIRSEIEGPKLPYTAMFGALPSIQKLSMSLPGFSGPKLKQLVFRKKSLQNLRKLHIRDCNSLLSHSIIPLLQDLKERGDLGDFELLEVETGSKEDKDVCEILLGERLLWKQ